MTRKLTFLILALFALIAGPGWGQTYEKVMELDMTTKAASCGAYNATTPYGDWKIKYGANNNGGWAYFKMGGKSTTIATYNPCDIYSTVAATEKIDKITVSLPTGSLSKSGMKVNSWGVYVYSDSNMATQIDYVAGGTITNSAATFDFYPSAGITWASGYFYKVSWNLANTTNTNGIVCVDKITLYKESTPSHTLTFSANNGSITAMNGETVIESDNNVEEGAELDITATANDWYKFYDWSVTGTGSSVESTTTNPTTFTMGTADATLTATFAACVVTVSSNDENWGIADYNSETHIISTTAENGYRISTTEPYTINPADAATLIPGEDGKYTVSGVKDQDVEITINFEALPTATYTVTFNAGTNGTCSTTELIEEEAGAGVTLPDCTPNTGYQFVGWATTNTATEADAGVASETYNPTEDITLYAVYNSVYTITWIVNGTPLTEGEQTTSVVEGEGITTLPTTPSDISEMKFQGWTKTQIETFSATAPIDLFTDAEHAPAITDNTIFYAVFAEKSGSEPAEQKTQTLQYDTWTYYGSTTDKDSYRLFHSGSYIESAEFDLSKLTKVIVYGGTFGGGSNNSLTIGDGTNTWKSVTVSGSSQTGTNTYTDGNPLSGTGKLRVTSNSGTASSTGVRISKVEIFTMEGGYTYSNYCTTVVTKTLTSISLSGEYPTEFWKGGTFSHEGMIVTAHYSNAPDAVVTEDATFSTPDMTTAGEQEVTVTYDTKQAKYNITVKTIVNTLETAYTVAEAKSLIDANPAGLATTEVYVKGTISQVDSYNSTYHSITYWISEDGTTTNQFEVYSGKNLNNTDFASKDDVKVGDDVVVYGIIKKFNSTYEFDKNNYIVSHVKASTLSIDDITVVIGGTITPVIETNVPETVYTIAYSVASEEFVKVQDGNLVTVAVGGPVEVTATLTAEGYKEATTTFEVTVIKALKSIAVKTAPTTTSYKEGDFFDPTGLEITLTYSDATTEDVAYAGNEDQFTFEPSLGTALATENTSVTITYAGKETTQDISVRALYTYDITWMANGEQFATTQVTEGNALVLPETNPDNVGDMVFQGWNTENYYHAETAPEYIVPSEIIPTGAMTFYAVYAKETSEFQEKEVTYTFTSKSWEDATSSWTSGKDGNSYQNNQGVQVTSGVTGANATSNSEFIGVTKAVVNYCTNSKAGEGTISVKVGEGTAQTYSVSAPSSGGTTLRDTDDMIFENETGNVNITVECTTNSIYINSITITSKVGEETISNFCTTVAPIVISENTVWDGNVTINGNTTVKIESDAVLTVNGVLTNTNADNLIIEDGGQLIHHNAGVAATLQKNVITYTDENERTGWNMVAAPFTGTASAIFGDNFDLYTYYEPTHYWIYNATPNLTLGAGYLFAKPTTKDTDFELSGTLQASNEDMSFQLSYTGTLEVLKGFNLVGNPFPCNAYVNMDYLVLDATGSNFVNPNGPIKPGDAILVQATGANQQITFSRNEFTQQNNRIDVSVSQNRGNVIDNARIRFGEGHTMNKFYLNENSTRLYIPQNGEDFAVIMASAAEGEMPLNFKAAKNGTYTITVNTDNVEANYLHLIDNLTGMDTDLLSTPSYTFDAKTSDYASRFKLVFGVKNDNEDMSQASSFAYISNGEIVISNEGRATLQVIDVLGRIVSSEEINGECRISTNGLTAGLYILNLNGMTQKIVVR